MEPASLAPPFVTELNRLLQLRAQWHNGGATAAAGNAAFTDADVLALAFLMSEMKAAVLLVDDGDLREKLERAGLAGFVENRRGRPLRVMSCLDGGPAAGLSEGVVVCLDACRGLEAVERGPRIPCLSAVVLYGLREPVPLRAFAALEAALGEETVLVSLGGRALALWQTTGAVVVPRVTAAEVEETLGRLSVLLTDHSLDPLHLAEVCARQQVRLRAKGDDELARLRARTRELEDEVVDLKSRLVKQQRSLALYNEMLSTDDPGRDTTRKGRQAPR